MRRPRCRRGGGGAALLIAALLVLALAGCGSGEAAGEAAAVVADFQAALKQGNGAAACALLAAPTRRSLAGDQGRGCSRAVLAHSLPLGPARREEAYVTGAFVELADRSAYFLERHEDGWKIGAAGCRPTTPARPYSCELES